MSGRGPASAAATWAAEFRASPRDERYSAALTEARATFDVVSSATRDDQIDTLACAFQRVSAQSRAAERESALTEAKAWTRGEIEKAARALQKLLT